MALLLHRCARAVKKGKIPVKAIVEVLSCQQNLLALTSGGVSSALYPSDLLLVASRTDPPSTQKFQITSHGLWTISRTRDFLIKKRFKVLVECSKPKGMFFFPDTVLKITKIVGQ